MSDPNQPAPAYTDVQQENDPEAGTGIATEAPAASGTVAEASSSEGRDDARQGERKVPPQHGYPSGATNTPPSDAGANTPAPTNTDDPGGSTRAGSAPETWPTNDGPGVSGTEPGEPDLENWGGTGLTTHDTEEAQ